MARCVSHALLVSLDSDLFRGDRVGGKVLDFANFFHSFGIDITASLRNQILTAPLVYLSDCITRGEQVDQIVCNTLTADRSTRKTGYLTEPTDVASMTSGRSSHIIVLLSTRPLW